MQAGEVPEVSLIVPVYNERERLVDGVTRMIAHAATLPYAVELLVVDDGSTDGTAAQAESTLGAGGRVIREPHRGKGGAVRAGMLAATGRYRIFLDVDLATPVEFVGSCVEELRRGADVVIGSRRTARAEIQQRQSPLREWLGRGYSLLSHVATGVAASDFTCGFKGFSSAAAAAVFSRQRVTNWSFDTEILFIATRLGLRIRELPVRWRDDQRTKVRLGRDVLGSLGGLVQIRVNSARGWYD